MAYSSSPTTCNGFCEWTCRHMRHTFALEPLRKCPQRDFICSTGPYWVRLFQSPICFVPAPFQFVYIWPLPERDSLLIYCSRFLRVALRVPKPTPSHPTQQSSGPGSYFVLPGCRLVLQRRPVGKALYLASQGPHKKKKARSCSEAPDTPALHNAEPVNRRRRGTFAPHSGSFVPLLFCAFLLKLYRHINM